MVIFGIRVYVDRQLWICYVLLWAFACGHLYRNISGNAKTAILQSFLYKNASGIAVLTAIIITITTVNNYIIVIIITIILTKNSHNNILFKKKEKKMFFAYCPKAELWKFQCKINALLFFKRVDSGTQIHHPLIFLRAMDLISINY